MLQTWKHLCSDPCREHHVRAKAWIQEQCTGIKALQAPPQSNMSPLPCSGDMFEN